MQLASDYIENVEHTLRANMVTQPTHPEPIYL